jgi:hypothetical protein
MLFQVEPPADTAGYMIAGYVVIFGIMFIYLISLILRNRHLIEDAKTLEEVERELER